IRDTLRDARRRTAAAGGEADFRLLTHAPGDLGFDPPAVHRTKARMKGAEDDNPVILVDTDDVAIGTAGKLDAHRRGLKHRAVSALVRNSAGGFLLQRRHPAKYHSGGLWANACCSHPQPGEETSIAARRRLKEETGFDTVLEKVFDFIYKVEFDNGLTEYEFDHVFVGEYEGEINFNKNEIRDI